MAKNDPAPKKQRWYKLIAQAYTTTAPHDKLLLPFILLTGLGPIALGVLAGSFARPAPALRVLEMVGAEPQLARAAVDERVAEAGEMARRLPYARVEDDRRVERDDVVPLLHHRVEPGRADVVLHQHAVVAVVVRRAETAVDLGRREDEAASAAQRDDLVHGHGVRHRSQTLSATMPP